MKPIDWHCIREGLLVTFLWTILSAFIAVGVAVGIKWGMS